MARFKERRFVGKFTSGDLQRLADELMEYATYTLPDKLKVFCDRVAERGIQMGETTIGTWGQFVTFTKTNPERNWETVSCNMIAVEKEWITSYWRTKDEDKVAYVNPLLMAEFGSGTRALPPQTLPDGLEVGQGTFPDQTHAFEPSWWYMDLQNHWHKAKGVTPTRPIFKTAEALRNEIVSIAYSVFRE